MTSIKHIIPGNKVIVFYKPAVYDGLILWPYNPDTIPWHPPSWSENGELITNPFYETLPKNKAANAGDILEIIAITGSKNKHRLVEVKRNDETYFVFWYQIRFETKEI